MKFNALSMAVLAAAAASMNVMAASSGTIDFAGEVTDTTCDVIVDAQGPDALITLPTVPTTALAAAADTAGMTGFNMALTNCSADVPVKAFFEYGATVDLTTGLLKNTETTTPAGNVMLQLFDGTTGDVIMAGNSNQNADGWVNIESGAADLPYGVQYYATDASTAGLVKSQVTYTITYQ